ncbi:CBS domain-containing protein [Zhongshania borealis]|jgi:acetoin utilization protein AcuB|uniref:CBS domain-containing protein n=1 Tax=Zhongshania borealis TaxID=889488 RepID=A0ABP7X6Z7_9GAMM
MKASKLMSTNLVVVQMDDHLGKLKAIFEETRFHHLLVVEGERLYGIISDRDLLKSLSPNIGTMAATTKDMASLNKKAHQIMTRRPIFLREDATIDDAISIFNQNKISCIPIVDNTEAPIGIISWRDIMRELGKTLHTKH